MIMQDNYYVRILLWRRKVDVDFWTQCAVL